MILELYVSLIVSVPIFLGIDSFLRRSRRFYLPATRLKSAHPVSSWSRIHLPIPHGHHAR
jgi:hypothetical protein